MFKPRTNKEDVANEQAQENNAAAAAPSPTVARVASPVIAARRGATIEGPGRRAAAGVGSDADKKLIVGKGLSLSGEITSCDILVVEGKVEAKLTEGKLLEITETGQFRGSVEIENADIAGRFDGQLVVHGRLTARATSRISGMVKYGELEVSAGGQIIGEMQVAGLGAQTAGSNGFKSAARFASLTDDEPQQEQRKTA